MPSGAAAHVSNADGDRWRAVMSRDSQANGQFVYAVRSTGIYCRPSCPSRRPRRDRVVFFDSPGAAEASGFRACHRCRPRDPRHVDPWPDRVDRACKYLLMARRPVPLVRLAHRVGVSPFHLQRNFARLVGLTPREYAEACRLRQARRSLRQGSGVTSAIVGAGYGSSSRFYERAAPLLGMAPATYARGGAGLLIRYAIVDSPLGKLLIGATDRGVCSVAIGSSTAEVTRLLAREYPAATLTVRGGGRLVRWGRQIVSHLEGRLPRCDLPLDIRATAFQWQVWTALAAIPRGDTRTYSQIARSIGRSSAARAVARACASNPVALLIPCHRVVPAAAGVGGYRWGVARKKALLAREAGSRMPAR
jgi:AraC family transcriptional regulator of adaptative response/methylated-DNA-[protein]-cysteine methyltransferase